MEETMEVKEVHRNNLITKCKVTHKVDHQARDRFLLNRNKFTRDILKWAAPSLSITKECHKVTIELQIQTMLTNKALDQQAAKEDHLRMLDLTNLHPVNLPQAAVRWGVLSDIFTPSSQFKAKSRTLSLQLTFKDSTLSKIKPILNSKFGNRRT
jgi:hypothetical protein